MDKYNLGTVGGMAVTELWSGIAGNLEIVGVSTGTITLSDNLSNYKFLVFDFKVYLKVDGNYFYISKIISSQQFLNLIADNKPNTMVDFCWGYARENDYFNIHNTSTLTSLDYECESIQCLRIVGIN